MEIVKIIGIGLLTVFASMMLKSLKPEFSLLISLAGGLIVLFMTVNYLVELISAFTNIIDKTGLNNDLLKSVLKIIGVGYLTEFAGNICVDSGNSSMADKIILAGKIIILVMALPIINSIIDILVSILPWDVLLNISA